LIRSPLNYTNIHPFTKSHTFFLLLLLLLLPFKLLFICLFIIMIWAVNLKCTVQIRGIASNLNPNCCLSERTFPLMLSLYGINISSNDYKVQKMWAAKQTSFELAGKCEKDHFVFSDPFRVTKMEICFVFLKKYNIWKPSIKPASAPVNTACNYFNHCLWPFPLARKSKNCCIVLLSIWKSDAYAF
jgi:hypothetical protein